jgi:hypothetical protein
MAQETDHTEAMYHVHQIENVQLWEILHDCFTQMIKGVYCWNGLSNRVRDLTTDAAPARLRSSVGFSRELNSSSQLGRFSTHFRGGHPTLTKGRGGSGPINLVPPLIAHQRSDFGNLASLRSPIHNRLLCRNQPEHPSPQFSTPTCNFLMHRYPKREP